MIKGIRSDREISLNVKLAVVVICAVIGVVVQFFINEYLCELFVEKIYMSDKSVMERDRKNIDKFIEYVRDNNISARNIGNLEDWQKNENYVDVIIFENSHMIFDSVENGIIQWDENDGFQSYDAGDEYYRYYYNFFPVQFKDGVYDVCIIDYSESRVLNVLIFLCFLVSFITLVIVIILYNKSQLKRIITLRNEVDEIEACKLDGRITIKGRDEISHLAIDIDDMRKRIIEQLTREQKAWKANSELVTSMAHDIRTPLTVLSGYLEILQNEELKSDEERDEYLRLCSEKADQLKDMTDKMFNFFFVYSDNDYEVAIDEYDAAVLFTQLFLEYQVLFEEEGFTFDRKGIEENVTVWADAGCLKRMMDNVFSNISKYADRSKPVVIEETYSRRGLHIKIKNSLVKDREKVVSTKIGVKTCRKLAGQMNARFWTEESNRYFMVHLVVPARLNE